MSELLLVGLCGGIGALIRFAFAFWAGRIPWGILIANTLGSFIAGWAIAQNQPHFLVVGLAGGISTFSSFAAQSHELLAKGHPLRMLENTVLNLVFPAAGFLTATLLF